MIKDIVYIVLVRGWRFVKSIRYGFSFENAICVIETGVLGDCMLVIHAFLNLESYCKEKEKELIIVCSSSMAHIFKEYCGMQYAHFVCFGNRDAVSQLEFKLLIKQLNIKQYEYIIRRDGGSLSVRIASRLFAKHSLYYSYDVFRRNKRDQRLAKCCFNEIRNLTEDVFIPSVWKVILRRIGLDSYKTSLGHISIDEKVWKDGAAENYGRYILIAPEGSITQHSLCFSHVSYIVSYIKNTFADVSIIIATDNRNLLYNEGLAVLAEKEKVKLIVGSTTLDEYIMFVAQAVAVITCDSGTVHLAASSGVPSVCLSGYWDRNFFLPYHWDVNTSDDRNPIVLYPREKPVCAYCQPRGIEKIGNCAARIKGGLSVECNFKIDKQDVSDAINKAILIGMKE